MKKILVSVVLLFLAYTGFSQMYVRVNVGYNLPLNPNQLGTEQNYGTQNYSQKGVYGSFGSGLSAHAAFGGTFGNSSFGYDVELGYLIGKKYEITSSEIYYQNAEVTTESYKSNSIQIAPSVSFTGGAGKISPYARIGPVLSITKIKNEYDYTYENASRHEEHQYSGGLAFGFKGALGANYAITGNFGLFAELNFISMSYAPKTSEWKVFTQNGVDQPIDDQYKKVDFKDEFEVNAQTTKPTYLRPRYSMGSIGLQFGVRYAL